ncbi:hypothetical protein WIW50_04630 [Flavobacteriaceae bacterium 3-367]|uniref:hypothetical protein n=1 Tax=Eudoraea algarum TaxID=3417568 RepID=UPI00327F1BCF
MGAKQILNWTGRTALLLLLFFILFIIGSMAVSGMIPDIESEPGLLPDNLGFFIFGMLNTLLIIALILSSHWHGWKLALLLAFAYYGAVTVLTQIETWYFMSNITVSAKLLPRLFIMGLPVAFVCIPLAVWILGKGRAKEAIEPKAEMKMSVKQTLFKLLGIALLYIVLYWGAGYYIAWQNPDLRSFYGSPGAILPFWEHTVNTLSSDPGLFPFQALRAMLWTLCAIPIIRGSKLNVWRTAVLLGLFFTVPQISGLILANPLMPSASVRLSHMIEGLASNFVFGMLIAWLLHREHTSIQDLFGLGKK